MQTIKPMHQTDIFNNIVLFDVRTGKPIKKQTKVKHNNKQTKLF
jgi:hypothetical protein